MSKICLMCGETFPDATTFCPKDGSALRASVHGDDLIGEVFCERYVVTDLLGEGGMGSVYAARDVRLPQQVAIKVLRDRTSVDPTTVARFRQEAEAASRINHDRVARVSDFGFMNDGRAYIIMEFVGGRTLKQVIDEHGPLTPSDTAKIVGMVAEGLDAAHRLGIVHRDLKPENVMIVDDAGGGMRVKVLDFGIAKIIQGGESAGRTAPGFVIGTPQWMSPEQILGETLDARSDVFALGLIAYSMLTAQRAYAGASEQGEMMARLTSAPIPLHDALPGVVWPAGVQQLIDRTLSREPGQRPAGALAFARELSRIVDVAAVQPAVVSSVSAVATPVDVRTASGNNASASDTRSANGKRIAIGGGALVAIALVAIVAARQFGGSAGQPATIGAAPPTTATGSPAPPASSAAVTPATDSAKPAATVPKAAQSAPPSAVTASTGVVGASAPQTQVSAKPQTNSTKPVATVGATSSAPTTPSASKSVTAAQAAAAHEDLQHIMDDADADVGGPEAYGAKTQARETLRKLDELGPRLTDATDRGWAQLHTGQSHATLGDNDKACAAFKRAQALSDKSPALKSSADRWLQTLNCAK